MTCEDKNRVNNIGGSLAMVKGAGAFFAVAAVLVYLSAAFLRPDAVVAAPNVFGSLDSVNCTTLTGWACDANDPNYAMYVEFYLDDYKASNYIGYTVDRASEYRSGISGSCGGTSNHGFTYTLPKKTCSGTVDLFTGIAHKIIAVAKRYDNPTDDWHPLNNGIGKGFQCGISSYIPQVKSSFDSASCTTLTGWVYDTGDPNYTMYAEFYLDDYHTGYIGFTDGGASEYRPAIGKNIICTNSNGNDNHGFTWALPQTSQIFDGRQHTIIVNARRYDNPENGNDWNLFQTTKTIMCSNCTPATCTSRNYHCGSNWSDNCGGTLNCGTCSGNQICNSDGQCVSNCVAATCTSLNRTCGPASDGCGNTLSCGTCGANQTCNSAGTCVASTPSCVATTCTSLGYVCGSWNDGCGNTLSCGSCGTNSTCSNGVCVSNCASHGSKKCNGGNLYWYNSCGSKEELAQNCGSNSTTLNFRCTGNLLEHQTIVTDCINGACTQNPSWSTALDCAQSGKICQNSSCVPKVQTLLLSGLAPSGKVYSRSATLSVTTNAASDCRYSWVDKGFDEMTLKFSSTGRIYHTATVTLSDSGSYKYYVKCRDDAGNENPVSGQIVFSYVTDTANNTSTPPAKQTTTPPAKQNTTPPADTTPPEISGLSPSGNVDAAPVTLAAQTNENATCKFDTADADFDSMENSMDGQDQNHTKEITLTAAGDYTYYVRCQDTAGNSDSASSKINFSYSPAAQTQTAGGIPQISGPMPNGTVYQNTVALAVLTDITSECRYSTTDQDYDLMSDKFTTSDGRQQLANVTMPDYGTYKYYVRCSSADGEKNTNSTEILFEYANPDGQTASNIKQTNPDASDCTNPTMSDSDGKCDNAADCVCDPDCGDVSQSSDPDCANAASQSSGSGWVIGILLGAILAVVIIVLIIIIVMKNKNGGDKSDVEDAGEDAGEEQEEIYLSE